MSFDFSIQFFFSFISDLHIFVNIIEKEYQDPMYQSKYAGKCYSIYVLEETESLAVGGFYAASIAYDLGKLTHLEQYGIDIEKI